MFVSFEFRGRSGTSSDVDEQLAGVVNVYRSSLSCRRLSSDLIVSISLQVLMIIWVSIDSRRLLMSVSISDDRT